MIPFLADADFSQLNAAFLKDALMLLCGMVFLAIGILTLWEKIKGKERKPSLDVDLADLARRVRTLEDDIHDIKDSLKEGNEDFTTLKSGQASNTSKIDDIVATGHSTNTRLEALTLRLDRILETFAASKLKPSH